MYSEFSRHLKTSVALNKKYKKVENQGMKEMLSLKGNIIPNEKHQVSIRSM